MRIYELAKELGYPSKDLVSLLTDAGLSVGSHMSSLSDADVAKAREVVRAAQAGKPASSESKKSPSAPRVPSSDEKLSGAAPQKMAAVSEVKDSKKVSPQDVMSQNVKKADMTDSPKMTHSPVANPAPSAPLRKPSHAPEHHRPRPHSGPRSSFGRKDEPAEIMVDETATLESQVLATLSATPTVTNAKGQEKFTRIFATNNRPKRRRRSSYRKSFNREEQDLPKDVTQFQITGPMRLGELATAFGKPTSDLILSLLKRGMVCNINYVIPVDIIKTLAEGYGIEAEMPKSVTVSSDAAQQVQRNVHRNVAVGETRAPIVVVMGHVDHGKTTLLDTVRKKNVAAGEKGGITQHLGAYEVVSKHGKIVFLDTPGHEAFSYIRKQGSKITDLAILVIAADDGIKPQTVEAIKHAKSAEVPIIVAINKVDKVKSPAAIETIKRQLSQYDLMTEDWGGQVVVVPISAKTGEGVDDLLEMIILQAQMMELKARLDVPARAFVLESHVEKGFGPVATSIVLEGVLKQGDFFMCGGKVGKVRLLIDSYGNRLQKAGASVPVKIVGFDNLTDIDEWFTVITPQEYSKSKNSSSTLADQKDQPSRAAEVLQQFNAGADATTAQKKKIINLIIKTDTRGSKEALTGSIEKLVRENKEINCPVRVLISGIGDISESDIELSLNTGAYLVGLHVKAEKNAQVLARDKGVTIHSFDIIYKLIEFLQAELNKRREVKVRWDKVAELVVRKVFDIKGLGVIAGCYVREGVVARGNKVACIRTGKTVGEAKIDSLQRDKKSVKEVHAGHECGFISDGFNEWQPEDTIIVYKEVREIPA